MSEVPKQLQAFIKRAAKPSWCDHPDPADPRQHPFPEFDDCVFAHAVWLNSWTLKELHGLVLSQWASTPKDVYRALRRLQRQGRLVYSYRFDSQRYQLLLWRPGR